MLSYYYMLIQQSPAPSLVTVVAAVSRGSTCEGTTAHSTVNTSVSGVVKCTQQHKDSKT
jgi:hypothetical protein